MSGFTPDTVLRVPELPEVETIRRGLEPLVVGRRIVEAGSHPSAKFSGAIEAVGARATAVGRRGKYLLIALGDADVQGPEERRHLVVHLGMTGQLRMRPTPEADPYVRAWWALDDGQVLELRDVRRFGRVAVVGADRSALPTLAALGPEPFDDAFSPEHLWSGVRRSRRHLKTQLLDQRIVAGVGNIYADEALWRAGVHPAARRLSRAKAPTLRDAIRAVLAEGIEHGGTTLRDYRTVEGGEGGHQHELDCYGRAGLPCPRCGTTLVRSVVDARGTTHCPSCQRR